MMALAERAFRAWVDPGNKLSEEHLSAAWERCDAYSKASWSNVAGAIASYVVLGEGTIKPEPAGTI